MNRIKPARPFKHCIAVLVFWVGFAWTSNAQTVTCEQCGIGVCEGQSLQGIVTAQNIPLPITNLNVQGDATGSGNTLGGYAFVNNGVGNISVSFTDGQGNNQNATLPVNFINASFEYSTGAGCNQMTFNPEVVNNDFTYSWSISKDVYGNEEVILGSNLDNVLSYEFEYGGTYTVCLSVTNPNIGCTQQWCDDVFVGSMDPGLNFLHDGTGNLNTSEEPIISICDASNLNPLSVQVTNGSAEIPAGATYVVYLNEVEVFSGTNFNAAVDLLVDMIDSHGIYQIAVQTTHQNCLSIKHYTLLVSGTPLNLGNAQIAQIVCEGSETLVAIANIGHVAGMSYLVQILCGDNTVIQSWQFNNVEQLPEPFSWEPSQSSCFCEYANENFNGKFLVTTIVSHPCGQTATNSYDYSVRPKPEANFTFYPNDNLCLNDVIVFQWQQPTSEFNSYNCALSPEWSITDPQGNITTDTTSFYEYNFVLPGNYSIELEVDHSNCGSDQSDTEICVSDDIENAQPSISPIEPNTPYCMGDDFSALLEVSTDFFHCEELDYEWQAFFDDGILPVASDSGQNIEIENLQKGSYQIVATVTLEPCGETSVIYEFDVAAPPLITTYQPDSDELPCIGETLSFDEWYCVDDCGAALSTMAVTLFQGELTTAQCENTSPTAEDEQNFNNPNECPGGNASNMNWTVTPGDYTLWVHAENACGDVYECMSFNIPEADTITFNSNGVDDHDFCQGAEIELSASLEGGSFSFQSCPNDACPPASHYTANGTNFTWHNTSSATPGDYTLLYSGECIQDTTVEVEIYPLPDASFNVDDVICEGILVNLESSASGTCVWTANDSTISSACSTTHIPTENSTTYTLTVTDVNNCQNNSSEVVNIQQQPFTVNCEALMGQTLCNTSEAVLELSGFISSGNVSLSDLIWTLNGDTVDVINGSELSLSEVQIGPLSVAWSWTHSEDPECVFSGNCDELDLTVPDPSVASINPDMSFCINDPITIFQSTNNIFGTFDFIECPTGGCPTASEYNVAGNTLTWQTNENTPTGEYQVVFSGNCIIPDTATFTIHPLPAFNIAGPSVICADSALTLQATGIDPSEIEENGCSWSPSGAAAPDELCSTTFPGASAGTYTLALTDENGCVNDAQHTVTIEQQPFSFTASGMPAVLCPNDPATYPLESTITEPSTDYDASNLSWELNGDPFDENSFDALDLTLGENTFAYTYNSDLGCPYSSEFTVNLQELTAPNLGEAIVVCAGEQVNINPVNIEGIQTGTWEFINLNCPNNDCPDPDNAAFNNFTWNTTPTTEAGDYTLSYSGICLSDTSIVITVHPLPDFIIESDPAGEVCDGTEVVLSTDNFDADNASYIWSNGSTADTVVVYPTAGNNSFSVTVTDLNDCSRDTSITIELWDSPVNLNVTFPDSLCGNDPDWIELESLISGAGGGAVTWSLTSQGTDFFEGADPEPEFIIPDTLPDGQSYELAYTYTQGDGLGCSAEGSIEFSITELESLTIVPDTNSYCLGDTVTYTAGYETDTEGSWTFSDCPGSPCPPEDTWTADGDTFEWLTDLTTVPGSYTLTFAGVCLDTTHVQFVMNALPEFTLVEPPGDVCTGDTVVLGFTNSESFDEWTWTDGNGGGISANDTGAVTVFPDNTLNTYTLMLTDPAGCTAGHTFEIDIWQLPFANNFSVVSDTYCANDTTQTIALDDLLTGTTSGGNVSWTLNSAGQDSDIFIPTLGPGSYTLAYTYTHSTEPGCVHADSLTFEIPELLTLSTTPDTIAACLGNDIGFTLSGTEGNATTWQIISHPGASPPPTGIGAGAWYVEGTIFNWATNQMINEPGDYIFEVSGTCLANYTDTITLFPVPPFTLNVAPGNIICADDTLFIVADYTGEFGPHFCQISSIGGNPQTGVSCVWYALPPEQAGIYTVTVSDQTGCQSTQETVISIQEQPFELLTDELPDSYCTNSPDIFVLDSLVATSPTGTEVDWAPEDIEWYLNDSLLTDPSFAVADLDPGFYILSYSFVHPDDPPGCTFIGLYSFEVDELTTSEFSGTQDYCLGETVNLTAQNAENIATGIWINTDWPDGAQPVADAESNWESFTWPSEGAAPGTYTLSYTGECLADTSVSFTLYSIPEVQWTPETTTPCMNECLPFAPDVLENYSSFAWTYAPPPSGNAEDAGGDENGGDLCFAEIGNPASVSLCLTAELSHPITADSALSCPVQDCHLIEPIASPGVDTDLPELACPGSIVSIEIDNLYDGCAFEAEVLGSFEDCGSIQLPNDLYGNFPYEVFLSYSGCTDTLTGNLAVPEPPAGNIALAFDVCEDEVQGFIQNLAGDSLDFTWSIFHEDGDNYTYLMDNPNGPMPVPNPVSFSSLDWSSDMELTVGVQWGNMCTTLYDEALYNFIAVPAPHLHLADTATAFFCLPQSGVQFEIFVENTSNIDSAAWQFNTEADYGFPPGLSFPNLQYPPALDFPNMGINDSLIVTVAVINQCGAGHDTLSFDLVFPEIFLLMPRDAPGVCPGGSTVLMPDSVFGNPFGGCSVSTEPLIPGLISSCTDAAAEITITVPPSTPPGDYMIETTIYGCGFHASQTNIKVFPDIVPAFGMPPAACTGDTILFENYTDNAVSFLWDFGDSTATPGTSIASFPTFIYNLPGFYTVSLTAVSDSGCVGSSAQAIEIGGPDAFFEADPDTLCSGGRLNLAFPEGQELLYARWEIMRRGSDSVHYHLTGNPVETAIENFSQSAQRWDIELTVKDTEECISKHRDEVFILPQPRADFTHGTLQNCAQGLEISFFDRSAPATFLSTFWDFDDPRSGPGNFSDLPAPVHSFSNPGEYTVTLTVENGYGCSHTTSRTIKCEDIVPYVPNAFTPNDDGLNELFRPVIHGIKEIDFGSGQDYTFSIFNRWGRRVFHSHDPDAGWNGQSPDGTHYSENELFVWTLTINLPQGARDWTGSVVLIR